MNFYRLTYQVIVRTPVGGVTLQETVTVKEWFTSERDAVRRRLALVAEGRIRNKKEAGIVMHEVPVRRAELLEWLNRYCV